MAGSEKPKCFPVFHRHFTIPPAISAFPGNTTQYIYLFGTIFWIPVYRIPTFIPYPPLRTILYSEKIVGMSRFIIFLILATCFGRAIAQPVLYTTAGSIYTQSFDGLPSSGSLSPAGKGPFFLSSAPINASGLAGWQYFMAAGTGTNAAFAPGSGTGTGNAVYSLGAAGSSDRALGSLSSGSGIYAFGLVMTNQTGGLLNTVTIGFSAEQWRKGGSGNLNTWTFRYKTGVLSSIDQPSLIAEPRLNFSSAVTSASATALNGNLPENQQHIAFTLSGLHWNPGEQLVVRWDDADETGSDDAVGIDNFSLTASLVGSAPAITAFSVKTAGSYSTVISASVNDNFSATHCYIEYDTLPNFGAAHIVLLPDSIPAGAGTSGVSITLDSLGEGRIYYMRFTARNLFGTAVSDIQSVTMPFESPVLSVLRPLITGPHSATLQAMAAGPGVSGITANGFVWSTRHDPSLTDHRIECALNPGAFSFAIDSLPSGEAVFVKPYVTGPAGITYGPEISFVMPVIATAFDVAGAGKTNAGTGEFLLTLSHPCSGLSPASFNIMQQGGLSGAKVTSVTGTGATFTVTVSTGAGDGQIGVVLTGDTLANPAIWNTPFISASKLLVDKSPPVFVKVAIPDRSMKIGDTVPVTIHVIADTDRYTMPSGQIAGYTLTNFHRISDSVYAATFIVQTGGKDHPAADSLPLSITLLDSVGNTVTRTTAIKQDNDALDATKPAIVNLQAPADSTYKLNDSLNFIIRFNEPVIVNTSAGSPSLTLTVGSKSKSAAFIGGSGTEILQFRYIVQQNDIDDDGIKTAGVITLGTSVITDLAGNTAIVSINNAPSLKNILVDGSVATVSAVAGPADGTYSAGDTLNFIVRFSGNIYTRMMADTPYLRATFGNTSRKLIYVSGSGTSAAVFRYIVQPGDLDKNGISLASSITAGNGQFVNQTGNNASLVLKNVQPLAGVLIDAVAPRFVKPIDTINVCAGGTQPLASQLLDVIDDEVNEMITLSVVQSPLRATLTVPVVAVTTTGRTLSFTGNSVSSPNEAGEFDSLVMKISDGKNASFKKIIVRTQSLIKNNHISAQKVMCAYQPAQFPGTYPETAGFIPEYAWEWSPDSVKFSLAGSSSNKREFTPQPGALSGWFRRRVSAGSCTDTSETVFVSMTNKGVWLGGRNADWNDAGNWCGAVVPDRTVDTWIFPVASNYPVAADTASCRQLTIAEGASLRVTGALSIAGNISAAGGIDCRKGKISMAANTGQILPGNAFAFQTVRSLVISNPASVSISDGLTVTGTLSLLKGTLSASGELYLTEDAILGQCAAGAVINGEISVARSFDIQPRRKLLTGHPFRSRPLIMRTGTVNIPQDPIDPHSNYYFAGLDAERFNAVLTNDSSGADAGWIGVIPGDTPSLQNWPNFTPLRLGVNDSTATRLHLQFRGVPATGDQEFRGVPVSAPCYQFITNPYLSGVDLSRVTPGPGIPAHAWLWDPAQGNCGGYTAVLLSEPNILPPFGAFLVKQTAQTGNTILFTEQSKTTVQQGIQPVSANMDDCWFFDLRLESGSMFYDRILVIASDSARMGSDKQDAEKMMNIGVNFYSVDSRGKPLSIDARPLNNNSIIPLRLCTATEMPFTITVRSATLPSNNMLMLHDRVNDTWTPLLADSSYSFVAGASDSVRFEIRSRRIPNPLPVLNGSLTARVYPVPSSQKVTVRFAAPEEGYTSVHLISCEGRIVASRLPGKIKEGEVEMPVAALPPGVYYINLKCGKYQTTFKCIKK